MFVRMPTSARNVVQFSSMNAATSTTISPPGAFAG